MEGIAYLSGIHIGPHRRLGAPVKAYYNLKSLVTCKHYIGITVDPVKQFHGHTSKPLTAKIRKFPIDAYDP